MIDPIRSPQIPLLYAPSRAQAPVQAPDNPTDGFTPSRGTFGAAKVQQQPIQDSPYPRPMTDREKADFQSWFPALDVETSRVTHEATPQYNCISWTTGNTQSWDWPPSMYGGDPREAFSQ